MNTWYMIHFKAEFFAANLAERSKSTLLENMIKNVRNGLGNNDNKVNDTYR